MELRWRTFCRAFVNIILKFNLFKPSGFFTYIQVQYSKILLGARFSVVFSVRIFEQAATYKIN